MNQREPNEVPQVETEGEQDGIKHDIQTKAGGPEARTEPGGFSMFRFPSPHLPLPLEPPQVHFPSKRRIHNTAHHVVDSDAGDIF